MAFSEMLNFNFFGWNIELLLQFLQFNIINLPNIFVPQALLSEASGSDLPSAATSLSEELSKMSMSSSIGLMAQGEAAPPMGGKTEESIRGQIFKVQLIVLISFKKHDTCPSSTYSCSMHHI